jgi:hypothetical protein
LIARGGRATASNEVSAPGELRRVIVRLATIALVSAVALAAGIAESAESRRGEGAPAVTPLVAAAQSSAGGFSGVVLETIETGGYVYVQLDTGGRRVWAAAPQQGVEVGDQIATPPGMPMPDYYSKSLKRTFDLVYFVAYISVEGPGGSTAPVKANELRAPHPPVESEIVDLSGISKAEAGTTVGEIFDQRSSLANQEVVVRGRVVKFTPRIMGKNWIHLRDGTAGAEGSNDLTVTTSSVASVGDTVVVRGRIALDKDFGYGYQYDVILEDASIELE